MAQPEGKTVIFSHYGQQRTIVSQAATVEDFLEENRIYLSNLDEVNPALASIIDKDNFKITINKAYYVKIIDGKNSQLETTTSNQPRSIVTTAGYSVNPRDQVVWAGYDLNDDGEKVKLVQITRAQPYALVVDGQKVVEKSTETKVGKILESVGYKLDKVAYVEPGLEATAKADGTILVYLKQANSVVKLDTVTEVQDGKLLEVEVLARIEVDPKTQKEVSRKRLRQTVLAQIDLSGAKIHNSYRPQQISESKRLMLEAAGIPKSDWLFVNYIISKESRWQYQVWNYQGSKAYGLCQALPAHKMASAGSDYMSNPITQLKWCHSYALKRYGSWQKAVNFWQKNSWW